MNLWSPNTLKEILAKHNLTLYHGLGQHFLTDYGILSKIIEKAEIKKTDGVLEIGPGAGVLTRLLAKASKKVVALEIDKKLLPVLAETTGDLGNVVVVNADAREVDFDRVMAEHTNGEFGFQGKPYLIVANLPYYATSPLIFKVFEEGCNVFSMTLMMQKEVAERIIAKPGSKAYGSLSVACQFFSDPKIVLKVPRTVFFPPPDVESAVVRFTLKENLLTPDERQNFFRVVRAAFAMRRKTIAKSLSGVLGLERDCVEEILLKTGINPSFRAEQVSPEHFYHLSQIMMRCLTKELGS
ncbi:16S rRNA (adenine(1518)-N(6)/adenine(1519)-N(6))-dimethyltransferase RsmA [Carboxydothermus pertinax]|uniref:Ribosomal RNA small subunit methyltransferase A n=1 Tax=Carboxydothermus pertinax TaxID=870242 RepID=A0A1L8CTA9_9THEO|nr:16S rRNA (adenine(1518)-N(6)/adenine(1519)-N(6))-dimethyltransferase RsmA [Carboxydothermus pertinax]GAV22143.1 16S rRNA (adenine(1518)-N(6)/adenine(1519)-N(6)) -dimethyltransferase [Carboxydothermus pertinax]